MQIVSAKILSINGGVHVRFTKDDDQIFDETLSGPLVPYDDSAALTKYIKEYIAAWNAGKEIEDHDASSVTDLIDQVITP